MRYVIGLEASQSSTTAVVADEMGCLLGIGHGGASNHSHESAGVERTRRSVADAIQASLVMAELENARISIACLSMTGGNDVEAICAPVVPADRLMLGENARIALYSVTFGKPGVVVISGMSSSAFGLSRSGETVSTGGWGHLMGDEGSGYWVALRGLNACARAQDGAGPATQILPSLLQHMEAQDLGHIQRQIYSGCMSRTDIAALSEIVGRAAVAGDRTARHILNDAGKELGQLVNTCVRRLNMQNTAVTIGTAGGVFRSGRLVLRSFREVVHRQCAQASVVSPRAPLAVGAALMAMEALGNQPHGKIFENVELSLARLGPLKC